MDTTKAFPSGRLNADVEARIQDLYAKGFRTARELQVELAKYERTGEIDKADNPSFKTLTRRIEALEAIYGSEPAGLKDYGDDARAILDVLCEVIEVTSGRVRYFTRFEVEWIRRLLPIAKGMQRWHVWYHARAYLLNDRSGHDTASLDHFFAYTPWTSRECLERYSDAFQQGRIDRVHWFDSAAYFGEAVNLDSYLLPRGEQ